MTRFPATLDQLAWYIERDGAQVEVHADYQVVRIVTGIAQGMSWTVPGDQVDDLNRERDRVYRLVQGKKRQEANR